MRSMERMVRLLFIILLIVFSAAIAMAAPANRQRATTSIKSILTRHHKQEYAQLRIRSGKRIEGTLMAWNDRDLTIRSEPDGETRTIALSQIDTIKFGDTRLHKISETKKDLRDLTLGTLNLFTIFTTGKAVVPQ